MIEMFIMANGILGTKIIRPTISSQAFDAIDGQAELLPIMRRS